MAQLNIFSSVNTGSVAAGAVWGRPGTMTQLASIGSGNFTPGNTYLIIAKYLVATKQVHHFGHVRFNGIDDPRFEMDVEGITGSANQGPIHCMCMGTWTAVAGHDVSLWSEGSYISGTGGTTHQVYGIGLHAIDLSQFNMAGNYWVDENSTSLTNMNDNFGDNVGASITFTPDGVSDYMVIGTVNSDPNTSTNGCDRLRCQIYDSIDGQLCLEERMPSPNTSSAYPGDAPALGGLWVLDQPAATVRTVSLRFKGANTWDHRFSCLFILRLNAFKNHEFSTDPDWPTSTTFTWGNLHSKSFTPVSDKALVLGRVAFLGTSEGGSARINYDGGTIDISSNTSQIGSCYDFVSSPATAFCLRKQTTVPGSPKTVELQQQRGTAPYILYDIPIAESALVIFDREFQGPPPTVLAVDDIDAQSSVDSLELGNSRVDISGSVNAQSTVISLAFDPPLPVGGIDAQTSLSPLRLGSIFSNPVVVNRAPVSGAEEYARETIRFGVKDADRQVLKSTIQCYIGYGSAWWGGGVLPEDDERTQFILRSRVGAPSQPVGRVLDGDELVLTKSLVGLQESIYEFGGLQAPANFDAPLMFEFSVGLDSYAVDAQSWTGVFAGLKGANKGVAIKFVDDGVKKIELHSADPASATAIYSAEYDWSTGLHTFKLLWYPEFDTMRLYVSAGNLVGADGPVIFGTVSAFPDLPDDEIPDVQPVGFFGHGGFNATSVSRWASVHLYNVVSRALIDGIPRGGHDGNFLTDASVLYDASDYPRKMIQPWVILPDSFGTIGGEEVLQADGRLTLRRTSYGESLGFYREEPKVGVGPTILDFKLRGTIADRPPGDGPESGIEVYVDDGTKMAAVEFLDSGGEQSVGLRDGPSDLTEWGEEAHYRLIVDPLAAARLMILDENDDGVVETEFAGVNYSFLPASALPGPGIGFLHDANVVQARGELHLSWLKYSLDARMWEGVYGAPASPWNQFGTGSPTLAWDILTIDDTNDGDNLGYGRAETLSDNKGIYIEAICKVDTYTKDGLTDQDRAVTGVGFTIDDDLVQYELMFAEAGPEFGKIAFLTTNENRDQNLIDIRARKSEVAGTYFAVDWTKFHHYRFERVVGGDIAVFVDWSARPVIQMPWEDLEPITSTSEGVRFGSLLDDRKTTSQWQSVRYGISSGWDIEALPNDDELRYENAVNVLVEVDS